MLGEHRASTTTGTTRPRGPLPTGNPYHHAQAESFMKTLKVEDVYIGGYETFSDVASRVPRFIEEVYNRQSGFTRCSVIFHTTNSNPSLLGRRLSLHEPRGPAARVHSI